MPNFTIDKNGTLGEESIDISKMEKDKEYTIEQMISSIDVMNPRESDISPEVKFNNLEHPENDVEGR